MADLLKVSLLAEIQGVYLKSGVAQIFDFQSLLRHLQIFLRSFFAIRFGELKIFFWDFSCDLHEYDESQDRYKLAPLL